jgi:hypothetical protein
LVSEEPGIFGCPVLSDRQENMLNTMRSRVLVAAICALPWCAHADLVFRVGGTVFANGKTYSQEEWDRVRNDPQARAAPQPAATAPTQPAAAAPAQARTELQTTTVQPRPGIPGMRAASCRTTRMYDEFPDASEKFACGAELGSLTREEMLQMGWKIDLIEKLPAPAGAPATSPRGLPLNSYKLILSR